VPAELRVGADQARAILAQRPTLAQHACKQQGLGLFGNKLVGTTLPHLVEHLAIDLLVEQQANPAPIAGNTTWLDKQRGLMRVRVQLPAGEPAAARQAAQAALNQAIGMVNALWVTPCLSPHNL